MVMSEDHACVAMVTLPAIARKDDRELETGHRDASRCTTVQKPR